ncbi:nitrous oxide reductase accessory protein NosL [Oharaeibacter diazotrophicus]|uniref:Copper chaperone NosL n=1 Tax=Oharaeibacter diazotrophicus TaxID=1920512 RepID=A0A4R6RH46_9HYPH|nr:nitrous oxide reductase accessory protein NosL [Oharaeibacter diazotrophicus]TDP85465.1 copper chaperone NosL [Oharaeibacter diazotrophicus]BBE74435.1 NosL protein [Pleomorphomonas sp. SM30]GLS75869.1 NosL protein [Oharaeibacter diazotrophicus]
MRRLLRSLALLAPLVLAACGEDAGPAKPAAVEMTDEALGYYCQMYLADHPGPKAQVIVRGQDQPLWFTQVSDAVAYLKGAERVGDTAAVYVSDMAAAASWAEPGRGNWIDADGAVFVIESRRPGGMGTPEAIPFGSRGAADRFVAENGGRAVALAEIPVAYVRPGDAGVPAHGDMSAMN